MAAAGSIGGSAFALSAARPEAALSTRRCSRASRAGLKDGAGPEAELAPKRRNSLIELRNMVSTFRGRPKRRRKPSSHAAGLRIPHIALAEGPSYPAAEPPSKQKVVGL